MLKVKSTKMQSRTSVRQMKPASLRRTEEKRRASAKAIGERFATAILSGDKREMDKILREIAEISSPIESPEEFLGLISDLLTRTARQAVQLHVLQEQLRNQALMDDLTGLHNRRGFFALAGQQMKYARRNRQHALLFFGDIDGLKQINDRFGHAEGDAAIRRMARVLERTFRDSDIVARLGGDEFAILAIEAGADSQEDIQRRLDENMRAETKRDPRYSLSISVGVARFDPLRPLTLHELLNSADRAMYAAKRARAAA